MELMLFSILIRQLALAWLVAGPAVRDLRSPNSRNARIIEVQNLSELQSKYAKLLAKPTEDIVFHIQASNSFVAQRNNAYWDIEENLEDLAKTEKQDGKNKNENSWVEFAFQKLYISDSVNRIPVSHCHSETEGQGGSLNIQSTIGLGQSLTGSFGIKPGMLAATLALTGSVSLDESDSVNTAVVCDVKHGEVVQLFLIGSQFLFYTPKVRMLNFDKKRGVFGDLRDFAIQQQRRAVIRGGLGEWVCGSSSIIPLQCSQVVLEL